MGGHDTTRADGLNSQHRVTELHTSSNPIVLNKPLLLGVQHNVGAESLDVEYAVAAVACSASKLALVTSSNG